MSRTTPRSLAVSAVVVALAVLAAGCGEEARGADTSEQGKPKGPPPALVRVDSVGSGALDDEQAFLAHVRPRLSTVLAAQATGQVLSVAVREGDRVEAGQVLVELDKSVADPMVDAARGQAARIKAELTLARAELKRANALKHPIMTDAEREKYAATVKSLEGQLRSTRAEIRRAQAELERHEIKAPFAALVVTRAVDPGAWVSPGNPLLGLVTAEDLEIHVDVPPRMREHIEVGEVAAVREPELGATVEAKVEGIVGALNTQTRTMLVRLRPEGSPPPSWLMPGRTVDVAFRRRVEVPGGLLVSRDALVRSPAGVKVMRVVDGKAQPVPVELIAASGKQALVRSKDLSVGDTLVVRGNERLRPGQPVRIEEAPPKDGPPRHDADPKGQ